MEVRSPTLNARPLHIRFVDCLHMRQLLVVGFSYVFLNLWEVYAIPRR